MEEGFGLPVLITGPMAPSFTLKGCRKEPGWGAEEGTLECVLFERYWFSVPLCQLHLTHLLLIHMCSKPDVGDKGDMYVSCTLSPDCCKRTTLAAWHGGLGITIKWCGGLVPTVNRNKTADLTVITLILFCAPF